ncbi:MAG TPA: EamA family transporter RarD [Paenalcaligenes sp.]|nr:EamA family transporter RarD [Paenalcaligenes sp.]
MNQGVALSVLASVLFALVYYTSSLLYPLEGADLFAWRIFLGVPALALIVHQTQRWTEICAVAKRFCTDWRFFLWSLISAFLFGVQLWLFVWAPLNNRALDVSMGYFLLPLTMVLVGLALYKERLSIGQWCAVIFAASGVLHELWRTHSFSWATALVALGYPPYFVLRRYLKVGTVVSLWFDFSILLIPSVLIVFISMPGADGGSSLALFAQHPRFFWQVPFFGMISAIALFSYIAASRKLPMGLFGLLGYVEPVLLFWVAYLLLGEPIAPGEWWTYIPIWIAVGFLVAEGAWRSVRRSAA